MKLSRVILIFLFLALSIDAFAHIILAGAHAAAGPEMNRAIVQKHLLAFIGNMFLLGCGLLALVLTRDANPRRWPFNTDFSKVIPPEERGHWRKSHPRLWQVARQQTIPAGILLFALFSNVVSLSMSIAAGLAVPAAGALLWLRSKELEQDHGTCFAVGYNIGYLKDLRHLKRYRLTPVEFLLSLDPVKRTAHPSSRAGFCFAAADNQLPGLPDEFYSIRRALDDPDSAMRVWTRSQLARIVPPAEARAQAAWMAYEAENARVDALPQQWRTCETCQGRRTVVCPACGGKGYTVSRTTEIVGDLDTDYPETATGPARTVRTRIYETTERRARCHQCQSNGMIDCEACDGRGERKIPKPYPPEPPSCEDLVMESWQQLRPEIFRAFAGGPVWRSGDLIGFERAEALPTNRCIWCANETQAVLDAKVAPVRPWMFVVSLLACGPLSALAIPILFLIFKRVHVRLPVCPFHRALRKFLFWSVAIFLPLGTGLVCLLEVMHPVAFGITGGLCILWALAAGSIFLSRLSLEKADESLVWIRGAGKRFRDLLPEYPLMTNWWQSHPGQPQRPWGRPFAHADCWLGGSSCGFRLPPELHRGSTTGGAGEGSAQIAARRKMDL